MSPIRTVIVDDEPLARAGLDALLAAENQVEVVGHCGSGEEALSCLQQQRPDLVFLDIQLPDMSGFDVLRAVPTAFAPAVVFVTAFDRYAIRAFDSQAVDYLLKPYTNERFRTAMNRVTESLRRRTSANVPSWAEALFHQVKAAALAMETVPAADKRLWFRVNSDYVFVSPEDIVWIEAQGDAVKVSAEGQIYSVRETLQSLEKRVSPAMFERVHRSFVVNRNHIRRITSALYGDYVLTMSDGHRIRLSRSYRDALKNLLAR